MTFAAGPIAAAALFFCLAAGAHAAELPLRDPSADCRAQAAFDAETYSFDEAVEAERCLATAQDFYDAVREAWPSLPEAAREACVSQVDAEHTINTLFYWSLYQCVDARRERSGGGTDVTFRF